MINKAFIDSKMTKKTIPSKKILPMTSRVLSDDLEDDEFSQKTDNSSKVKYLPPSVMKDIEQKNAARKLAGLPPIITRIRRCLTCGAMFQSAGNRTCGCTSRVAGIIAGREII